MAARLAFAGNCAAPCNAAAAAVCNPDAVTITWLVPRGEDKGVEVVCVVLVSLALDASEMEAEAEGEGLREGDVTAEEAGGAVEITVAVLLEVVSVVPVTDKLVTAGLVRGSTGLTVRVVAALLVTRLGVVATSEVGQGKIALMGELLVPPLLGGLILFSFWRRLQNQTRITSFSMFSWSAIMVISSEVGFWFSRKLFSKATRMLVSMLVRFFLLRFTPSIPCPGEFRALGLERVESDERFSASLSHFSRSGFNLHMFLKLRFKASKREMVVWLKSFP